MLTLALEHTSQPRDDDVNMLASEFDTLGYILNSGVYYSFLMVKCNEIH